MKSTHQWLQYSWSLATPILAYICCRLRQYSNLHNTTLAREPHHRCCSLLTFLLFSLTPYRTSLCLTERWDQWQEQYGVQVVPTTASFSDAWDGDDTLVYDPDSTAAFILSECLV